MSDNAPSARPEANARPEMRDESILMYRVASMHFQEHLSNLNISRELGISRFRVARLLEQASLTGMVEIHVALPALVDEELSSGLTEAFGLRASLVLPAGGDDRWIADGVSALALAHVSELLRDGDLLGVAWDAALDDVARTGAHLRIDFPCVDVVQLVGAVPSRTGGLNASDLVRRLSLLTGGKSIVLNAPVIVPSASVAAGLRAEPSVAASLSAGESVSVALFGIGATQAGVSVHSEMHGEDKPLGRAGTIAVAEVCGIPVAATGDEVQTEITDRMIGITADALRRIPRRVAVVFGQVTAAAVTAALRAGFVTDLIIDAETARCMISDAGVQTPHRLRSSVVGLGKV